MDEELITSVYYWQDGDAWIFSREPPEGKNFIKKDFDKPLTFDEACDQITIMWQP